MFELFHNGLLVSTRNYFLKFNLSFHHFAVQHLINLQQPNRLFSRLLLNQLLYSKFLMKHRLAMLLSVFFMYRNLKDFKNEFSPSVTWFVR